MAILKPSPMFPNRFSFGTIQSLNISSVVDEPLIPILSSSFPILNPGKSFSTINADMPLVPLVLSVIAKIIYTSACPPFVINILVPFNIYLSPSRIATVCCPAASVPAFGSVSPNAPSFSPFAKGTKYFCFCSSVPYL